MAKRRSLNPLRDQLNVLVNQANRRAEALIKSGVPSRALAEAQRTLRRQPTRLDDDTLFKSDLKSRRQINRELARVHSFLNDYTSTIEGAKNITDTSLSYLKGAFGGEWLATTGEHFDTSRIDKDVAKEAFELYRLTIEASGGWERAVGIFQGKESLIGYGSENVINAIYDMKLNGYSDEDILNNALDMINEGHSAYEQMAKLQVEDYDYGVIFDDETAKSRRDFYTWKRRFKSGK